MEPDLFKVINGLLDYPSIMPLSNLWPRAWSQVSTKLRLPGLGVSECLALINVESPLLCVPPALGSLCTRAYGAGFKGAVDLNSEGAT